MGDSQYQTSSKVSLSWSERVVINQSNLLIKVLISIITTTAETFGSSLSEPSTRNCWMTSFKLIRSFCILLLHHEEAACKVSWLWLPWSQMEGPWICGMFILPPNSLSFVPNTQYLSSSEESKYFLDWFCNRGSSETSYQHFDQQVKGQVGSITQYSSPW